MNQSKLLRLFFAMAYLLIYCQALHTQDQMTEIKKQFHWDDYIYYKANLYYQTDSRRVITVTPQLAGILFDERFKDNNCFQIWDDSRYLSSYSMIGDSSYVLQWSTIVPRIDYPNIVRIGSDGQYVAALYRLVKYVEEEKGQNPNTIILFDSLGNMTRKYSKNEIFHFHTHMFRDTSVINILDYFKLDDENMILYFDVQLKIDKVLGHYIAVDTFSYNLITGKLSLLPDN